tara:strand:- start:2818 stop:3159 length:342 start_codon:yes stop_codon:yes gene_type:complete
MKHVDLYGHKYPLVVLHWRDIAGDSTTVVSEDFEELVCAHIITIGYLYDTFIQDGERYVRTFASYEIKAGRAAFGDRNVYPMSVFTARSRKVLKQAINFQKRGNKDVRFRDRH